jgi:hypothetical protein
VVLAVLAVVELVALYLEMDLLLFAPHLVLLILVEVQVVNEMVVVVPVSFSSHTQHKYLKT